MDTTTQQRIQLLASVILKNQQYKYLTIEEQKGDIIMYNNMTTEQKKELGQFFSDMSECGFVFYGFNFARSIESEKIILTDFANFDFVFTRPTPKGTTFYTQIQDLKEKLPNDFIQYIPNSPILADILQA